MRPEMMRLVKLVAGGMLLPSLVVAQARGTGALRIGVHVGLGLEGVYYDDVVQFSDGGTDFLTLDPGTAFVLGAQVGYRMSPGWTLQFGLTTASRDAEFIDDLTVEPDVKFRTTEIEAGVLYDLRSFPVGGKAAPFMLGGGLTVTRHSLDRMTWSGEAVDPSTTSFGVHGLAALDIPLAPTVSLRLQGKLVVSSLSRGGLEDELGRAESVGQPAPVTASLDGGTGTRFAISTGLNVRL